MVKKVLFILMGFGLITAGIAGISTSLVDQKNKASLQEIEELREQAKSAAAEEEKRLEEKRQEIDKMAMDIAEKEKRIEQERRRAEEHYRSREAAVEAARKEAAQRSAAGTEKLAKSKESSRPAEPNPAPRVKPEARKSADTASDRAPRRSYAKKESRTSSYSDEDVKRISRKAALEAVRLSEPVKYRNRETNEIILAEPYDRRSNSVRIRLRIWRNESLVKDTIVSYPESPQDGPGRYESYGAVSPRENPRISL